MAAGFPDFGMHDDAGVEAGDVVALLGHAAPPVLFDVTLEFRAEWAVVPKAVDAAVDLRRLENKSPAFAERHDLFHQLVGLRFSHKERAVLVNR